MLEDAEKSYHAEQRVTENDIFDNRLIFGANLLALKAEFTGKVKCVFIDRRTTPAARLRSVRSRTSVTALWQIISMEPIPGMSWFLTE